MILAKRLFTETWSKEVIYSGILIGDNVPNINRITVQKLFLNTTENNTSFSNFYFLLDLTAFFTF